MSCCRVRTILGFTIVRVGNEPFAVFRRGLCVESGFLNFNAARMFALRLARVTRTTESVK